MCTGTWQIKILGENVWKTVAFLNLLRARPMTASEVERTPGAKVWLSFLGFSADSARCFGMYLMATSLKVTKHRGCPGVNDGQREQTGRFWRLMGVTSAVLRCSVFAGAPLKWTVTGCVSAGPWLCGSDVAFQFAAWGGLPRSSRSK